MEDYLITVTQDADEVIRLAVGISDAEYWVGEARADLSNEIVVNDEASLYDALSDVTDFVQPGDAPILDGANITGILASALGGVLEDLDTLGAATADSEFIVATGAGAFAYESGATVLASLGLSPSDSIQLSTIELGHASDTTLSRSAAGVLAVEGVDALLADGSVELTADWDIGDGIRIEADEIRARDGDGLKLFDDGGNGIFVKDGGYVGINIIPTHNLHVDGDAVITEGVILLDTMQATATTEATVDVRAYVHNADAGTQKMGVFSKVYTVSGETSVDELDGLVSALYHDEGFTVPTWKGLEAGGAFVSGAGSVVTEAIGADLALPTCTDGGAVTTAKALNIGNRDTSGITNAWAIYSEISANSWIRGDIAFGGSAEFVPQYDIDVAGTTIRIGKEANSSKILLDDNNGVDWQIQNGVASNGLFTIQERSTNQYVLALHYNGNSAFGHTSPDTVLDINGAFTFREKSADPSDPDEGAAVLWMSDGTGSGSEGDILMKITAGGVTKTTTRVDFSAL